MRDVGIVLPCNGGPIDAIIFTYEDIVRAHTRNTNKDPTRSLVVLRARVESDPRDAHDIRAISRTIARILDVSADVRETSDLRPCQTLISRAPQAIPGTCTEIEYLVL